MGRQFLQRGNLRYKKNKSSHVHQRGDNERRRGQEFPVCKGSKQRLLSSMMQKLITRHIMYEQSIRYLTTLSLT